MDLGNGGMHSQFSSSWPVLGPRRRSIWYIYSDYIIKEKTVLLQKRDSEGFGFVLRGAKAQTPIEEFTPTPAFPALQYLESVDEGGVAWRAGLRMGDFLIELVIDVRATLPAVWPLEFKGLASGLSFDLCFLRENQAAANNEAHRL
ncbi:hypothetical protein chiPu_0021168 [Chiloscyllium punctatum]|uniref:PDZ domain-containing protein n=1 Tax=Chiloscyllium punctatum TaxID=137246 RepID=A0A401RNU2_CHIPU|nr:hypothetical protein [Chiloscyllium punctatum]